MGTVGLEVQTFLGGVLTWLGSLRERAVEKKGEGQSAGVGSAPTIPTPRGLNRRYSGVMAGGDFM